MSMQFDDALTSAYLKISAHRNFSKKIFAKKISFAQFPGINSGKRPFFRIRARSDKTKQIKAGGSVRL